MATWTHKGNGYWEDSQNWDTDAVPGPGETVNLSNPPSVKYVVSIDADESVDTVNITSALAELLIGSGDTLSANTINPNAGALFLQGAISGASINANGGTFRSDDGELDNVTWNGALALDGAKSTSYDNVLAVQNLSFGAGSSLAVIGYDAELDVLGDMTLGGASLAAIALGGAGKSNYIKEVNGGTLTLDSTITSDAANAHVFLEDDGNGGTIVNQGSIAFGDPILKPKGTGEIETADFNNFGAITISDQSVDITSSGISTGGKNVGGFTNEATGFIALDGGTLTVHDNGTVFNVGGSISLSNKSTLDFYHTATGTGTITLSGASLADIDNYTGNIAFGDGTDVLRLESLSAFKGEVQDFQIGDSIDFSNVAYGFGDYVTVATNASTGVDTVTVHKAGGATAASFKLFSLDFENLYNGADFTLNQDPSLGLDVGLTRRVAHDFNGDGISDALFVNPTTRQIADWQMSNTGVYSGLQHVATAAAGWSVVGNGDFNNDGVSDILLENATSHALEVWNMSGSGFAAAPTAVGGTAMASPWRVAGVGDFNGDGTSDILWQSGTSGAVKVWSMANDQFVSVASISNNLPGAGWTIKGVGDFNGDGVSDALWVNSSQHELIDWQMGGGKLKVSEPIVAPSGAWTYVGIGDFKGDGTAEALIEGANHTLNAWNVVTGSHFSLGTLAVPTGFAVASVGDYNGDGVSDVMLYNKTSGAFDVGLSNAAGHIAAWTAAGVQGAHASWNLAA